jgi:hypothetical protein
MEKMSCMNDAKLTVQIIHVAVVVQVVVVVVIVVVVLLSIARIVWTNRADQGAVFVSGVISRVGLVVIIALLLLLLLLLLLVACLIVFVGRVFQLSAFTAVAIGGVAARFN